VIRSRVQSVRLLNPAKSVGKVGREQLYSVSIVRRVHEKRAGGGVSM
jgi:hypothetical protein